MAARFMRSRDFRDETGSCVPGCPAVSFLPILVISTLELNVPEMGFLANARIITYTSSGLCSGNVLDPYSPYTRFEAWTVDGQIPE
jgi:hypothetical protein